MKVIVGLILLTLTTLAEGAPQTDEAEPLVIQDGEPWQSYVNAQLNDLLNKPAFLFLSAETDLRMTGMRVVNAIVTTREAALTISGDLLMKTEDVLNVLCFARMKLSNSKQVAAKRAIQQNFIAVSKFPSSASDVRSRVSLDSFTACYGANRRICMRNQSDPE